MSESERIKSWIDPTHQHDVNTLCRRTHHGRLLQDLTDAETDERVCLSNVATEELCSNTDKIDNSALAGLETKCLSFFFIIMSSVNFPPLAKQCSVSCRGTMQTATKTVSLFVCFFCQSESRW